MYIYITLGMVNVIILIYKACVMCMLYVYTYILQPEQLGEVTQSVSVLHSALSCSIVAWCSDEI